MIELDEISELNDVISLIEEVDWLVFDKEESLKLVELTFVNPHDDNSNANNKNLNFFIDGSPKQYKL